MSNNGKLGETHRQRNPQSRRFAFVTRPKRFIFLPNPALANNILPRPAQPTGPPVSIRN
jgi:hypothetical protein